MAAIEVPSGRPDEAPIIVHPNHDEHNHDEPADKVVPVSIDPTQTKPSAPQDAAEKAAEVAEHSQEAQELAAARKAAASANITTERQGDALQDVAAARKTLADNEAAAEQRRALRREEEERRAAVVQPIPALAATGGGQTVDGRVPLPGAAIPDYRVAGDEAAQDISLHASLPKGHIEAQPRHVAGAPVSGVAGTSAAGMPASATPTNPTTSPAEQAQAIRHEKPHVVAQEKEKAAAEEREIKGKKPEGTVIDGIEDDQLWSLMRRFDTHINHVLHPARSLPPSEPDLRMTNLPDVPFRSDTLKSNFERCIAALGPPSVMGFREVKRITDWNAERWRTGAYCLAYFVSWFFGYTVVGCCTFFAVLICFPETRRYLFPAPRPPPHTPVSATDPTNQSGDESLLGNVDGKVKHRTKAEQAEEQAFEARAVFEAYTQAVVMGGGRRKEGNAAVAPKDHNATMTDDYNPIVRDETGKIIARRDPTDADKTSNNQGQEGADAMIAGQKVKVKNDKDAKKVAEHEAKRKRDEMVANMAKGTETGLGAIADTMEILQHAMSPPEVYPDHHARFKIAAALCVPPALLLHFVPAWMWGRIATFAFGAALWGQPLAIRAAKEFMRLVPNWQELMDPRNSLLSNTPTNAQLVLHLLRVSEDLGEPLPPPPPPPLKGTPKEALKDTSPADQTEDDAAKIAEADSKAGELAKKAQVRSKHKLSGAFKKVSRKLAGFKGDVAVDGNQKQIGGGKVNKALVKHKFGEGSPDAYPCKLGKVAGHLLIDEGDARIAFCKLANKEPEHIWQVADIVELRKDWVSVPRIAAGWLGGADVESLGLWVRFAGTPAEEALALEKKLRQDEASEDDNAFHFASVERREQLFNRLIAMGPQRWEVL